MKNIFKIALRNLLRYKRRTLLTSILIILGVVMVVVFSGISKSFKDMMIGTITNSCAEMDVVKRISFILPNEKWNSAKLIKYKLSTLMMLPTTTLISPNKNPSTTNSHKIFDGSVPMAEMVPISLTLS